MGMVIDSSALAGRLSAMFDTASPGLAYRVRLGANDAIEWDDGRGNTLHTEPETSWGRRLKVLIFSLLPIEWLL
jgi:hypothetical protein